MIAAAGAALGGEGLAGDGLPVLRVAGGDVEISQALDRAGRGAGAEQDGALEGEAGGVLLDVRHPAVDDGGELGRRGELGGGARETLEVDAAAVIGDAQDDARALAVRLQVHGALLALADGPALRGRLDAVQAQHEVVEPRLDDLGERG